jgi:hypothetical protein
MGLSERITAYRNNLHMIKELNKNFSSSDQRSASVKKP